MPRQISVNDKVFLELERLKEDAHVSYSELLSNLTERDKLTKAMFAILNDAEMLVNARIKDDATKDKILLKLSEIRHAWREGQ